MDDLPVILVKKPLKKTVIRVVPVPTVVAEMKPVEPVIVPPPQPKDPLRSCSTSDYKAWLNQYIYRPH